LPTNNYNTIYNHNIFNPFHVDITHIIHQTKETTTIDDGYRTQYTTHKLRRRPKTNISNRSKTSVL
jgi:hypothetical protein